MTMDVARFDRWARDLIGRRSLLTLLVALAAADAASASSRHKRKPKRCRKTRQSCRRGKPCCGGLECAEGRCCQGDRVFVNCPNECLCADDPTVCCAHTAQSPPLCPTESDIAPAFCCPADSVCGDTCCIPELFFCNAETNTCQCALPDPKDCPSGSGGFSRVRRVK